MRLRVENYEARYEAGRGQDVYTIDGFSGRTREAGYVRIRVDFVASPDEMEEVGRIFSEREVEVFSRAAARAARLDPTPAQAAPAVDYAKLAGETARADAAYRALILGQLARDPSSMMGGEDLRRLAETLGLSLDPPDPESAARDPFPQKTPPAPPEPDGEDFAELARKK